VRGARAPLLLLPFLFALPAAVQAQEPGEGAEAAAAFLFRLAGTWAVTSEAVLAPGQDPIRSRGREVSRMLGTRWFVAEGEGETPTGAPVRSLLTLGYDQAEEGIVGTWIDSMQGTMWRYRGTLDPDEGTLVLEAEGPVMGNPAVVTRYREVVELRDDGLRVMRSSILGPDGAWFEYGRAEYRRVPEG
jgi:hypothetical protein